MLGMPRQVGLKSGQQKTCKPSFWRATLPESVLIMLIGVAVFFIGFHAMDTAQNMGRANMMIYIISDQTIPNFFSETNSIGLMFTVEQIYYLGIYEMIVGFIITVHGAYLFGKCIGKLSILVKGLEDDLK